MTWQKLAKKRVQQNREKSEIYEKATIYQRISNDAI